MGKADKAQAVSAGRVPLVQAGKPLLYPRYSNIDDLLQIGKSPEKSKDDGAKDDGTGVDDRPSKKQKRAAAAATREDGQDDGEQAASAPVGQFATVDKDGLTYKQRRQMRRAAERAVKAQADAEAAAVAAAAAAASGAEDGDAAGVAPPAASAELAGAATAPAAQGQDGGHEVSGGVKEKKKKEKKKDKRSRESDGAAAGPTPAVVPVPEAAKGNADEAARMRAVLGFTTAGGGSGVSLAALAGAAAPVTAPAAAAAAGEVAGAAVLPASTAADADVDVGAAGGSSKKQKKDKKDKKNKKKGPEEEQQADGQDAAEPPQPPAEAVAVSAAATAANGGVKIGRGATNKQFSFEFKVQAAVEAETEARLARIMALDTYKDGFVPRRVWVTGIPHEFDEETIREYWGYCGEVEAMHMLTFPDSGNFNGTAFITFTTQAGYDAALACNGEMLEGRALRVEKCKAAAELKGKARASAAATSLAAVPPPSSIADGAADAPTAGGSGGGQPSAGKVAGYPVAYCGNISFEAGVEELQQLFAAGGVVPTKVRLHTDKSSGRSKGFAHVHFASDEDVDKAIALDGTAFHGRKIRVSYAQPKPGEA